MERTTTVADVFAPWPQAQQAFWERWRAAMVDGATPTHSAISLWSLPIEFSKAAVYGSLDVQLAMAEVSKAWICANDASIPEITLGTCQAVHFIEDWTRTQMQLWEGWFAALESLGPPTATEIAGPEQHMAKPRSQVHTRQHRVRAHVQPHNGVPA